LIEKSLVNLFDFDYLRRTNLHAFHAAGAFFLVDRHRQLPAVKNHPLPYAFGAYVDAAAQTVAQ